MPLPCPGSSWSPASKTSPNSSQGSRTLHCRHPMSSSQNSAYSTATCTFSWPSSAWWALKTFSMPASTGNLAFSTFLASWLGPWQLSYCGGSTNVISTSLSGPIEYSGSSLAPSPSPKCLRITSCLWTSHSIASPSQVWQHSNVGNFVLAVYGIYRPEDNDTLTLIDNEDVPGMFKLFF